MIPDVISSHLDSYLLGVATPFVLLAAFVIYVRYISAFPRRIAYVRVGRLAVARFGEYSGGWKGFLFARGGESWSLGSKRTRLVCVRERDRDDRLFAAVVDPAPKRTETVEPDDQLVAV